MVSVGVPTAFAVALAQYLLIQRAWRRKLDFLNYTEGALIDSVVSKRNKVLVAVLSFFVVAEFGSVIAYFVKIKRATLYVDFADRTTTTIERTMNVIFIVTDTSIAGSLVYLLQKNRSGFRKTDSIIHRLILFTISTSAPTAVVACAIFFTQQVKLCRLRKASDELTLRSSCQTTLSTLRSTS